MNSAHGPSNRLEAGLRHHFRPQEPDQEFLAQLRRTLIPCESVMPRRTPPAWHSRFRFGWRYVAGAMVLALLAAIAAVGPDKVLAQIQDWLGYVPGLGEVNLVGTRVLAHPVSRTEGDITLAVVEFVASPDQTLVKIHVSGVPRGANLSSRTVFVQWEHGNGLRMTKALAIPSYPPCPLEGCPAVRQPDGYDLQLAYLPLPPDVQQVQLVWLPWGIVPGTSPSDTWVFDIVLEKVSGENDQGIIQPAYAPLSAADTHFGVGMTVDRVFSDASSTIVDTSILVPPAADFPSPLAATLSTDSGELYEPSLFPNDLDLNPVPVRTLAPDTASEPALTAWPTRWQFDTLNPTTRLTLTIGSIELAYRAHLDFEVEVGRNPSVGTIVPLDVSLNVDGFPVHINQAQVVMATSPIRGGAAPVKSLQFGIDSPLESDGRKLTAIWFSPHYDQEHADPYIDPQSGLTVERLTWNPSLIRDGRMIITVDRVVLELQGPWVLSWDVPAEGR